MALQNFDQLNSMATKWFSIMDISDADKKRRVDLSLDYCEIIIMLFLMIDEGKTPEECVAFAEERLKVLAEKDIGAENVAYINDWSQKKAADIVDTTFKHIGEIKKKPVDETPKELFFTEFGICIPENEYWTSELRALLVGIDCASAISNFHDMWYALERGMTNKVWITEGDERVRQTHQEVDHTDIPINDLFQVGASYLMFPGDMNYGAEAKEVINCRCHLEFYKR